MWEEAYNHIHNDEQNYEREQREVQRENYDEHEPTTYERAQYERLPR